MDRADGAWPPAACWRCCSPCRSWSAGRGCGSRATVAPVARHGRRAVAWPSSSPPTRRGRRCAGVRVEERLGDRTIPRRRARRCAPGHEHRALYSLPTDRRGVLTVGPARRHPRRSRPACCAGRSPTTPPSTVWVHPAVGAVAPAAGRLRQGPRGPDVRRLAGGRRRLPRHPAVRDRRRPAAHPLDVDGPHRRSRWCATTSTTAGRTSAVLLDGDAAAFDGDEFETGVEVAASLVLSSMAGAAAGLGPRRQRLDARPGPSRRPRRRARPLHDVRRRTAPTCSSPRSPTRCGWSRRPARSSSITARRTTDELLARASCTPAAAPASIVVNVAADVDAVPPSLPGARCCGSAASPSSAPPGTGRSREHAGRAARRVERRIARRARARRGDGRRRRRRGCTACSTLALPRRRVDRRARGAGVVAVSPPGSASSSARRSPSRPVAFVVVGIVACGGPRSFFTGLTTGGPTCCRAPRRRPDRVAAGRAVHAGLVRRRCSAASWPATPASRRSRRSARW